MQNKLKNIKPCIDNGPPRTTRMKHLQVALSLSPSLPLSLPMSLSLSALHLGVSQVSIEDHLREQQVNRKKKEMEFQRFSSIERENFRLLDSMSKIMVRGAADSVFGVHRCVCVASICSKMWLNI